MVAVLLRLKLAILRRSLARDGAALFGLVMAGLVGAALVMFAAVALIGARTMTSPDAHALVVPGLATLTLGWLLGPLVLFGSDETLDAGRFALLPVDARKLRPGLALSGLLGVPGIALVVIAFTQIVTWTRSPLTTLFACVSAVLGTATCVLLTRTVTAVFSQALASRRMRDVAAVFLGVFAASGGLFNQAIARLAGGTHDVGKNSTLRTAADITGWTPFGWIWSAPADAALGRPIIGLMKLVLDVALIAVLWMLWGRCLDRALQSPLTVGDGGEVSSGRRLARLSGANPTAAVTGRCLRYWRRDPRYLSALVASVVVPVVMTFSWASKGDAIFVAPVFFVAMACPTLMADISYDNSAFWLHVSTGLSMRADRWGRVAALGLIIVPLTLVVEVIIAGITGHWAALIWSLAVVISLAGSGAGIAAAVGAYQPGQAPPPGSSSFGRGTRGSGGGMIIALCLFGCWIAAATLSLPVILLAAFGLGWVALLVAPFIAAACLVTGVRVGAARLERTLPEMLARVSR